MRAKFVRSCGDVWFVDRFHRSQEPITDTGQGFQVSRRLRRISQSAAELTDDFMEAAIVIPMRFHGPENFSQLLPADDLPGTRDQDRKHLECLSRQFQADAKLAQLAGCEIDFEAAATKTPELPGSLH